VKFRLHIISFFISALFLAAAGSAVWAASGTSSETHSHATHETKSDQENIAGIVTRLSSSALAVQDAQPRVLMVDSPIYVGDVISTGPEARIEITMIDETIMTLGESAVFIVIDYVFQGDEGNAATRLLSGALRSVSGKIAELQNKPFKVYSEFGTVGIRGTDFWAGYLHGEFHIGLLGGAGVYVENEAGRTELTRIGDGTKIKKRGQAPTPAESWANDMLNMSKESVSFE